MKKTVKIIVWSLAGLAVVLYGVMSATAPLKLELTQLRSETARISFTEQGFYAYQESCGVYR
jgi:hypothetical protein